MGNAAKVGAFVTAFVVLLIGAYAVLGKRLFAPKTKQYFALFEDANGVTPGTPVLMAGVAVGSVDKITLDGPRQARMTLSLQADAPVLTGTTALVPTSLIGFGSPPITLVPPATQTAPLATGSTIAGRKGSPLDSVLPDSKTTVAEVNKLLVEVRTLISDKKFKKDAQQLLANSDRTIKKFGDLADNVNRLMVRNQSNIDTAILRGSRAMADVQRITYQVAQLLEKGTLQKDAQGILTQLKETSKKADQLVASMNELVSDPNLKTITTNVAELTNTSKGIAANVAQISETGKSIAANADVATKNGVEISKNGVEISKNLVSVTAKVDKLTENAIGIEGQVKDLLEKVNGVLGKGGKTPKLPTVGYNIDLMQSGDLGRIRNDLSANVGIGQGQLTVGLWDAFESNKLILQYGQNAAPGLDYRYGIYAGKPGLGVDYRLLPRLTLRNDVWDLNRLRYDPRLRYDFGGGFVGWFGLEKAFDRNTPIFGIGISR